MIHTGMIFCKINRNIFEKFRSHPGTYWHKQDGTWANTSYTADGLTYLQARYVRKKGYEAVHVTCRLNFKRLIEKDNHVLTYRESDHDAVVQAFNEIMLEVGLPLWNYWQVGRIDYCVDVKTDHVADYICLMQKGSIPYSQKLPYNSVNKRREHKRGSLYLIAKARDSRRKRTGSMTVNFYDKYQQKLHEQEITGTVTDAELDQAKDILRLEIQCFLPKINSIKDRYHLSDKTLKRYLSDDICCDVIENMLLKITHKGAYRRKSEALKVIDASSYQTCTKIKLKAIIEAVSKQYQSVAKVRESFIADGTVKSKEEFARLIKKLDDLDVNPVTLGDKKAVAGLNLKQGLPNVYDLFFDACQRELCEDSPESLMYQDSGFPGEIEP
jgi:hypothetical protein